MVKWDESDVEAEIIGGKADDGQHANGETGVIAIERGGMRGTVGAAGRARAKAFRRELRRADIDQWARGEQRYRMAMILNRLSFSYNSIKRLVSKRRH